MDNVFQWHGMNIPLCSDANEEMVLTDVQSVAPKNLRVCNFPYPHLRDDEGCVLARDYADLGKLAYILDALDYYDPR